MANPGRRMSSTATRTRRLVLAAVCVYAAGPWLGAVAAAPQRLPTWNVLFPAGRSLRLAAPAGLAIDRRGSGTNKWMYLADTGNNRIVKLGTGGRFLRGWGSRGAAPGQFQQPPALAVDLRGDVYVVDTGNDRVQYFDSAGRLLGTWGGKGAGPGQFDTPAGIAVGGSGNVFVADRNNHRIEKFSPSGRLLAVWSVAIPSGPAFARFGSAGPYALAIDARGNVYAAVHTGLCSGGHCVMDYILLDTFNPSGRLLRSLVGGNPYGGYSYGPIPALAGQGPWWQIGALATDPSGHLFLAEWTPQNQSSVVELSAGARVLGQWELPQPSGGYGWPGLGLALDPRGNIYVADSLGRRVLKLHR